MKRALSALKALCIETGCVYHENEPMSAHTSFKIGGPVDLYLEPETAAQIACLMQAAAENEVLLYKIGKGSNLLVRDEGIRGVVMTVCKLHENLSAEGKTGVYAGAGASLDTLCRYALERSLTGLEFAYGIPGSVGGAIYMNAGAYGGEMCDVLESTAHIDTAGQEGHFKGQALKLSYRHSVYTDSELYCITGAHFRLREGEAETIRARMEDLKRRRREKQPLEFPSAGSTFKRPAGNYASALIDGCGLKGRRVGGAMVSEKHAGFVVNDAHATCADVLELIEQVRGEVFRQTGYLLECEVKLL